MPDSSKIFNGKKFMWDNVLHETEKEVQELKQKYESDNFEVELVEEVIDGATTTLIYTRRVITEIVLEGEPPA